MDPCQMYECKDVKTCILSMHSNEASPTNCGGDASLPVSISPECCSLKMPVVTVDVALPATEPIAPTLLALPGRERLVVLKIHAVSGTDEVSLAVPRPAMTNTHPRLLWRIHGARGDARKLTIS